MSCPLTGHSHRHTHLQQQSSAVSVSSLWFVSLIALLVLGCDTVVFYYQAAKNISTSYDALIDLFDCIGNFLKRLEIHRSFTRGITEIAVKVLAELLSVLGLATKQIKMGRFGKYIPVELSIVVQGRLNIIQRSLERNC